nr:hypothetical protein [Gardnerella vaginalis]
MSTTIKQQNAQLYQSTQAKAFSKYTPPPITNCKKKWTLTEL